jgi:hypothetical protein
MDKIVDIPVGYKVNYCNDDFSCLYTRQSVVDEVGTLYKFIYRQGKVEVQEFHYVRFPCGDDEWARKTIKDAHSWCYPYIDYEYADYQYVIDDLRIIRHTNHTDRRMVYIGVVEAVCHNHIPYCYLLENDIDKAKELFIQHYNHQADLLKSDAKWYYDQIENLKV